MAGWNDLVSKVTKTFDKVLGREQAGAEPEPLTTKDEAKAAPAPVQAKPPETEATPAPKPEEAAPEPAAGHEDLLRTAVERLSEDEALRGDLSDVGFGPLLDWATAAAEAYSPKASNAAAMEEYTDKLRKVVEAAVNVAQNARLDDPAELLDFETTKKDKVTQELKSLQLGSDADANAEQLAKALQAAL
jgi:hypothetical protein